jgi:hypothetical protein
VNQHSRALTLATIVAERDFDSLSTHLSANVRLRALLPGGPIEQIGRDRVLTTFTEWFGSYRTVTLEDAVGELVGDRLLVHYRLAFDTAPEPRVLTQTWVSSLDHVGVIFRIDLLCSGFREP